MNDEIVFTIGDDGVAREYKDDYDITIHCESKEEQELAWELLNRRWIPCSERLPEEHEYVLATTEWGDITMAENIGNDEWFIHEGDANATTEDLLAWMPLPKPYEEEGKEE